MEYIPRLVETKIKRALDRNKSVLLLGARQTGKTTLAKRLETDLAVSFIMPDVRLRYEKNPTLLREEVEALKTKTKPPLVFLDEIQKVPEIMDVVQGLIDEGSAKFLLTGSSARKLMRGHKINLLPGRVVSLRLDPLTIREHNPPSVEEPLLDGSLPGILSANEKDREIDLRSYVTTYLEEEVRAEALVRNIGSFAKFLEYAASESGQIVNFKKLSQEIGVSHTTIESHYRILEDCLVAERVEPITKSRTRKKLTKSEKYLFFDLGIRRAAAAEGRRLPRETMGRLFEQLIGLELIRSARFVEEPTRVRFWRDPDGPEVDWVIEKGNAYTAVEVKWTASPSLSDTRSLKIFLSEYPNAKTGFIVCQAPRRLKLDKKILAVPWQETGNLLEEI